MSRFERRQASNIRILELKKLFVGCIECFEDDELTISEVNAVLLKMLTQSNDGEIKNETA